MGPAQPAARAGYYRDSPVESNFTHKWTSVSTGLKPPLGRPWGVADYSFHTSTPNVNAAYSAVANSNAGIEISLTNGIAYRYKERTTI